MEPGAVGASGAGGFEAGAAGEEGFSGAPVFGGAGGRIGPGGQGGSAGMTTGGTVHAGGTGVAGGGAAGAGPLPEAGAGGEPELGDNPWQNSTPFCRPDGTAPGVHSAVDLWSKDGSVYLMIDSETYANTGTGWSLLSKNARTGSGGITGFVTGPLVRYGDTTARCGIETLDSDGNDSCSAAIATADHVYVVHEELAFAAESQRILIFDGRYWIHWAPQTEAFWGRQLWASESTLLVAAADAVYVSRDDEAPVLQQLPDDSIAAGASYSAAWGLTDDDLWVGNTAGELFHGSGETWTLAFRSDSPPECREITGIWGAGRQLFFTTVDGVYTIDERGLRRLASRPCEPDSGARFWDIWGNSPEEVFVVEQTADRADPCGDIALTWFDGTRWGHL